MKKNIGKSILAFSALALSFGFISCNKKEGESSKVTKVKVAHTNYYVPYDFVNDKGESDGLKLQF